jgi:hypothetical protein
MAITINGNGPIGGVTTLTNLDVGGLPNGVVTPADLSQPFTSGTAVTSPSGTSVTFTGIPSWVKRITILLSGVSFNAGAIYGVVRIGDSGGIENTGYVSYISGGGVSFSDPTAYAGFYVESSIGRNDGQFVLSNVAGNTWVGSSVIMGFDNSETYRVVSGGGSKTLSATLDRVVITTQGGTASFDAGSINILYE